MTSSIDPRHDSSSRRFRCFIIGEGTLPIQCAKILLQGGHDLYGIISPDPLPQRWAEERNIPHAEPTSSQELVTFLSQRPFDYLFSIVNYVLLPEILALPGRWAIQYPAFKLDQSTFDRILALPRRRTINYHDAPLPKYAGFYATSWAIMEQETTHGVTWHVMTGQMDAGDILKQHPVDVAPDETAFTLNAKCYAAAIASFAELVDDLASGQALARPQNLAERTFFPLYKRPPAGGVLSWHQSAKNLDAFVRALQFGPYPNPLGLPKLAIGQDWVIVSRLDVLDAPSTAPAGTVTGITDDAVTVSTTTQQIALRKLLTINGQPLSVPEFVARFGLYEQYKFEQPATSDAAQKSALVSLDGHPTAGDVLCEKIAAHEAFWVNRLLTLRPINLPYATSTASRRTPQLQDTTSPKVSQRHASLPLSIPPELVTLLAEQRSTWRLNDVILAAFAVYLARVSGTGRFDIGFGAVALRHDLAGPESLFASHVPLRLEINPAWSFQQAYEAVQTQVALTKRQNTYARDVVARYPELGATSQPSGDFAWPVVVEQVEKWDTGQVVSGGELILVISTDGTPSACRERRRTACCLIYDTNVFDPTGVTSVRRQFTTLLHHIAATQAEQPVWALSLLTQAEQRQLLVEGNDTTTSYPPDPCLHQLFEDQVEKTPPAIAVVRQELHLTYRELNRRANQLAHHLEELGVGPETRVGICVERSPEMVIGLLGVLKAGAAYVPLDPTYPRERLAFMVKHAQVPVLLTQQTLAERFPGPEMRLVRLDADWEAIADHSVENPTSGVAADNLAYVIYTSGSTGQPKGVMISHRAICNHMHWMQAAFPLTGTDAVLQKTPFSFDASVWEFYAPLLSGARLILARPEGHKDGAYLVEVIAEQEVTTLQLVPTLLRHLLQEQEFATCRCLKRVFCGGEALPAGLVERFYALLPATLYNLYGPTEAAIDATFWACAREHHQPTVPIGHPIANVQAFILDSHLQPVPVGVTGELYLGGAGLARGYLNRPDLTAERFVPNPFAPPALRASPPPAGGIEGRPGARLYKTGDLARYLPTGAIEFLGRADHQVKVRGFRIELGEIEATLRQHPAVEEAVTMAQGGGHQPSEGRLVAYLVAAQNHTPTGSALRSWLKEKLPDYMLPSVFVLLQTLPLTPNGKIDHRALPTPDTHALALDKAYVAPRTPIEAILAGLWADVLGLERVGIHNRFFELGGHSLLATRLLSRLRDEWQIQLPLRTMLDNPTVAVLAQHIGAAARPATLPLLPVSRDRDLPLSFAQQRLWFLEQLQPNIPVYNIPTALRLIGPLDVVALERSLDEIIRRHEALRTTFVAANGRPFQIVAPRSRFRLPVVDLPMPDPEREIEVRRLVTQEARRSFDLARGPLLRATLLRLSETEHVLLLTVHHIVFDGWSLEVLFRELSVLYRVYTGATPSPLPALPVQYPDFAVWQREWLVGKTLADQLAYWKQRLAGDLPLLQLPTDRPRPPIQTFRGAIHAFTIPKTLLERLKTLSQQESVTLFMTLLAAFKVLLARCSGQTDVIVGSPMAGRNWSQVEHLIGFFVNTLVLRSDLSGDPTFRELLERVREVTAGAYAHQDTPFEKLVGELRPERDLSHQQLFQVMFALTSSPLEALTLPGLRLESLEAHTGTAMFDLTLSLEENSQGLSGRWEYSSDLFDAATISRLAGHLRTLLEGIVTDPEQRTSDLPLLTGDERRQLLVEWNDTQAAFPGDVCFHQLFEAQAARQPDALAVVFQDRCLTYQELNRRANQLAHHLQGWGVGPEARVGLCLERSPKVGVALLGILKAGGVYVPLDPTYPRERLAFMLRDAQVSVLLTRSSLIQGLPQHDAHIVCLDADGATIAQERTENPTSGVTVDNLAYVIYTSGSTGEPKGSLIVQRGLTNLSQAQVRAFSLRPGQRVLQFSSLSFDASIAEMVMALGAGATLCLAPQEALWPGPGLRQLLRDMNITIVTLPPSALTTLPLEELPALELMTVAGETCSADLVARWASKRRFLNLYGPTEATIWAAMAECTDSHRPPPIGRPIANVRLYVLDAHLQPVPVGVPGELYIGGVSVGRGYLNRPGQTAEKFIPDPFPPTRGGARLYKTGDLGRHLPDGNVEFLGRSDHQVKVRGFRIEPGEIEAVLAGHPALRETAVLARDKRLVAYLVPHQNVGPTIGELRSYLKEKLPDYMVPSAFVFLPALPLTPSGKIDRRALPAPDPTRPELESTFVPPRTRTEEVLARIWADVLGIERVGVHDNFFELGGDSILSIQIIARANQAGQQLAPRQLFQHRTIAELAAVASQGLAPTLQAEQDLVTGSLPLTPIQHWFFEQQLPDPHHWNMPMLLQVRQPIAPALLEQAVQHLVRHHDALRLRFVRSVSGWRQFNAALDAAASFTVVDLTAVAEEAQGRAIEAQATRLQSSLNLSDGPLVRVALFDLAPQRSGRLLMVVHHLTIDGVSWRILLEDLQTAYQQLGRGEAIQLPPKTTSFKRWAEELSGYAQSLTLQGELDYWLAQDRTGIPGLPLDSPNGRHANTVASARTVSVSLSVSETRALLQKVPAVYRTRINDVLLTALAQAFVQWTGARSLLIDLEGHGREEILPDVRLSRTVGWFTTVFPVRLDLGEAHHPGDALKSVKEQLRRVPNGGIGYGLLRYLSGDATVARKLRQLAQAQVSFNYLGQLDQTLAGAGPFGPARESGGPPHSLRGKRRHLIDINGRIAGGRLRLDWTFSENLHRQATMETLAQGYIKALRSLIAHCRSPEAGGYTPSDFDLARLAQPALDRLAVAYPQLEDLYPLSPGQQEMFWHTQCAPGSSFYFLQWHCCALCGDLDVSAFKRAWQQVVDRNTILRSAFIWEGLDEPLQIVHRRVELPWHQQDWRGLTLAEQQERGAAFLQTDRKQGFELSQAPLMRFALFQVADQTFYFVWSHHHLLLDGWSHAPLWKQVFAFYQAFREGRNQDLPLEHPRPYRDYIAWLGQQDLSEAESFWRGKLKGVTGPTRLEVDRAPGSVPVTEESFAEQQIRLSPALTDRLQSLAQHQRLTLNTLVQGTWALLLSRYSGRHDVLFGVTVSGRPADLAGVESIVGPFINTLPLRVKVHSEHALLPWLKQLQNQQAELRQYDYCSLAQIREWSQVPPNRPLFESFLRFQNYPQQASLWESAPCGGMEIENVQGSDRWHYPLGVTIEPGSGLSLGMTYDQRRFDTLTVTRMLSHLQALLESFVSNPDQRLGALTHMIKKARR